VKVQTRRTELPGVLDRLKGTGIITLGWVLNELSEDAREATLRGLVRRVRAGNGVLIFAPLSLRASPWWPDAVRTLRSVRPNLDEEEYRCTPLLPQILADLDRATRLNHRTLGARVLYVPPVVKPSLAKE